MATDQTPPNFTIRMATAADAPLILTLIRELADYERLTHEVVADVGLLREHLFGPSPAAEVIIGSFGTDPVGFALFFPTFSTFLGRPGLYLEDLYVRPAVRGRGIGRTMLAYVAHLAVERGCGRLEWAVLDWNAAAIGFYRKVGAAPMDEWTVFRLAGEALEALANERNSFRAPGTARVKGGNGVVGHG